MCVHSLLIALNWGTLVDIKTLIDCEPRESILSLVFLPKKYNKIVLLLLLLFGKVQQNRMCACF